MIKLALEAGKATPAPPVGPALGSKGVNIMAFCKDYNARTADKAGYVIPVEITVYDVSLCCVFGINCSLSWLMFERFWLCYQNFWCQDKSFTFILKTPPASVLLLKAAGICSFSVLSFCSLIVWCWFSEYFLNNGIWLYWKMSYHVNLLIDAHPIQWISYPIC